MVISRRAALKGIVAGGVGVATGTVAHGFAYARHRVELVRASLPVAGLPAGLRGLRIGLITDLHHSEMVPREDVEAAVALLMGERPDLIVMGGDYVTWGDRKFVEPCAEVLAALGAPHGVYAALGNHDDDQDMAAALGRRGFTVLKDARTRVDIGDDHLEIAGLRYWTTRASHIARVLKGGAPPILLIAHDPRRLEQAAALDVGLVLSGHTHGGQVVLPVVGAVAARKFPVVAGMARRANTTIFVSRGVGTVYAPYRLNCPPDVALLTLG